MSTYIYVHPKSPRTGNYYEAFIVSDDGIEEPPRGYIETTGSSCTGENQCFHVKPLQDEVSTSAGKFTLGVDFRDCTYSRDSSEDGYGINYLYMRSSWTPYTYFYYVASPGSTGHFSFDCDAPLHPPACRTSAELLSWFRTTTGKEGYYSGNVYTRNNGWYWYAVSPNIGWCLLDRQTAYTIAGSTHWSESLNSRLDTMYLDAVSELKFNMNNIANSMQAVDLFKSLRSLNSLGKEITQATSRSLAKSAADAWLKYRYAYLTTKSDVEEFTQKAITARKADTGVLHVGSSLDGFALNMKISYKPYDNGVINGLLNLISMPKRLGVDPSLYNVWDMVPFSFIADWFVPIGDNLERISNCTWARTMPYTTSCLASYKGTVVAWGKKYQIYSRFDYIPSLAWSWISKDQTSLLTATKRGLDVIALTR